MKKTMFITSVIMVVVMAIALTTSSLAWFTATGSGSVSTQTMSITANTTTSSGLLISNTSSGFGPAAISLGSAMTGANPLVPLGTDDNPDLDALLAALNASTPQFIGNKFVEKSADWDGDSSTPDTIKSAWKGEAYSTGYFSATNIFVANAGTSATTVYVRPVIDSVAATSAILNIAVLAQVEGSSNPYISEGFEIVGIWKTNPGDNSASPTYVAQASTVAVGKYVSDNGNPAKNAIFKENAKVEGSTQDVTVSSLTGYTSETIGAYDGSTYLYKQFKVVAWYEGSDLKNGQAGENSVTVFSIEFSNVAFS